MSDSTKERIVKIAYIVYEDGSRSNLAIFFSDDDDAFNSIMDEMMILCQKNDSINHYVFEEVSILGELEKVCQV